MCIWVLHITSALFLHVFFPNSYKTHPPPPLINMHSKTIRAFKVSETLQHWEAFSLWYTCRVLPTFFPLCLQSFYLPPTPTSHLQQHSLLGCQKLISSLIISLDGLQQPSWMELGCWGEARQSEKERISLPGATQRSRRLALTRLAPTQLGNWIITWAVEVCSQWCMQIGYCVRCLVWRRLESAWD